MSYISHKLAESWLFKMVFLNQDAIKSPLPERLEMSGEKKSFGGGGLFLVLKHRFILQASRQRLQAAEKNAILGWSLILSFPVLSNSCERFVDSCSGFLRHLI